jgi:hypothetical protein
MEDLHVQSHNTLTCEEEVINIAINYNNRLPLELRKIKGERKFQPRLKGYLLEHPYYTLHDFYQDSRMSKNLLSKQT